MANLIFGLLFLWSVQRYFQARQNANEFDRGWDDDGPEPPRFMSDAYKEGWEAKRRLGSRRSVRLLPAPPVQLAPRSLEGRIAALKSPPTSVPEAPPIGGSAAELQAWLDTPQGRDRGES